MRLHVFLSTLFIAVARAADPPTLIPPSLNDSIPTPANGIQGEQIALVDRGVKFTLFFPAGWYREATNIALTAHFHTVASSAISSHVRRGSRDPLVAFALGSGSSAYRVPFEDTNRFDRVLSLVETEMRQRGFTNHITTVDLSSFSAGYGAVRELVKSPHYYSLIRRIVLLDSIYGGLVPQKTGSTARIVDPQHIDAWIPFAKAAMRGEKTFIITLSQIEPATFASTLECASALLDRLALKLQSVSPPPTNSLGLLSRADAGNFHVWSYAGTNATAHMAHVQHMAEIWRSIETR